MMMGFFKVVTSFLFVLLLLLYSCNGESQRLRFKMYEDIEGAYACFRRLNGTHQFGCSSSRSGNVGVVHIIENQVDADWMVNNGLAAPYVAVIHPSMFTRSLLLTLQASSKVNGVVLINNSSAERPVHFSHEDTCPNRYSGLSMLYGQTCSIEEKSGWNPHGTSVLLMDWEFPIFYVTDQSHIDHLYDCYEKHNVVAHPAEQLERGLCAVELKSHMYAAVNSKKCMKRNNYKTLFSQVNSCDPLGGRNVWQTLFPRSTHKLADVVDQTSSKQQEANGSIAVLAARMDATSMFDGLVPASVGAVSGIVTLISTAQLLFRMLPEQQSYDKNVLFLLLAGESYDYIGSSRIVFDMKQGTFPVKPDPAVAQPPPIGLQHIGPFIELSQLNKPAEGQPLYVHRLEDSSETKNLIKILQRNGNALGIPISDKLPPSKNLPPASLQTFLAERPDIPGLVLTEHASQYSNNYYHSVFDETASLKYVYANKSEVPNDSIQAYLANVSTTLAHSLYEHVTNETYFGSLTADKNLVDELLHCYLEQSNCSLFQSAVGGSSVGEGKPLSYYVGVSHVYTLVSILTGAAMALLTGSPTNFNQTDCHNNASTDQVYQYIWVSSLWNDSTSSQVCLKTTMNFSSAVSPAFIIDGYDMASGKYSTWTESVWPELTARMFLKPSFYQEVITLVLGIVVLGLSFAGVFYINGRKAILFSPGLPST